MIGEDIFATIFAIILIFVFIAATNMTYQKYLETQDMIERERAASSLAQQIYFSHNGLINLAEFSCPNIEKTYIEIYASGSSVKSCGARTNDMISSSMPVNVLNTNAYQPGRLIVYVSK